MQCIVGEKTSLGRAKYISRCHNRGEEQFEGREDTTFFSLAFAHFVSVSTSHHDGNDFVTCSNAQNSHKFQHHANYSWCNWHFNGNQYNIIFYHIVLCTVRHVLGFSLFFLLRGLQ